ncbi:MAG: hypothetical protein ACFCVG_07785 [Kineosporiaceae bacterium]
MIILGIALTLVALVVLTFVAVGGSAGDDATVTVSAFGVNLTTTALVMFLAGAATLLLLLSGLWLIRWGAARAARTRTEMQRLRRIEAEVEARQVAELSESVPARAVDRRPPSDGPTPSVPPGERVPGRDHDDTRDETRVVRPFQREQDPTGARPAGPADLTPDPADDGTGRPAPRL